MRWLPRLGAILSLVAPALGALASGCLGELTFQRGEGDFCDPEAPCVEGFYCALETNACTPKVDIAARCESDEVCLSGNCAKGFCCVTPCEGPCKSCNLAGSAGECEDVAVGSDPVNACPGTTACGASGACQGRPRWVKSWGDQLDQRTVASAVDSTGQIYVVGAFVGTLEFATGPLQNSGEDDIFVAKLDRDDGDVIWAKAIGGQGRQVPEALVVDDADNLYIAGFFDQEAQLDESLTLPGTGGDDGLVLSLDDTGELRWALPLRGSGDQRALSLDVGLLGVAVGGWTMGEVTVGGCAAEDADEASRDGLLVLLSAGGNCNAVTTFGTAARPQSVNAVAFGDDTVFVGVSGRGGVDFGAGLTSAGTGDVATWLAALEPDFDERWSLVLDTAGDDEATALATDGDGGIWLVGNTTAEPAPAEPNGVTVDRDVMLAHYDGDGVELRREIFAQPYSQTSRALTVAPNGDVVIAGDFELVTNFGNGPIQSEGASDAFVAKLDPEGDVLWSLPIGSRMHERATGLAIDPANDEIVVTLDFQDRVQVGSVVLTAAGGDDILVVRLAP